MFGVNVAVCNSISKLVILSKTILCVWFMLFLLIFLHCCIPAIYVWGAKSMKDTLVPDLNTYLGDSKIFWYYLDKCNFKSKYYLNIL